MTKLNSPRMIQPDEGRKPVYVVWELTLRCDHACSHCGSRAGPYTRPTELSLDQMYDVCAQLQRLGTREVTLIGGEAYLSPHFLNVVRRLTELKIRVSMQTGGLGINPRRAAQLAEAGVKSLGFSIDGPADVHDVVRGRPGSWALATAGLKNAVAAGLIVTSNSQVNRLTADRLPETAAFLHDMGVKCWRCQLTVPMGRAADRPEWILEPWRVVDVIDTLAELQESYARGVEPSKMFNILIGNNLGYYGPHEVLLRSHPGTFAAWWRGCQAGKHVLGIESDGTVKACPSLPTAPYVGGNVRELTLEALMETPEVRFSLDRTVDELWGFCATCEYADTCRAGCSFTAHTTLGKRGNNPFCYHRVVQLSREGVRERLVQVEKAPGELYDFGRFEIVREAIPTEG